MRQRHSNKASTPEGIVTNLPKRSQQDSSLKSPPTCAQSIGKYICIFLVSAVLVFAITNGSNATDQPYTRSSKSRTISFHALGAKSFADAMKSNISTPILHTDKRELRVRCRSYGDNSSDGVPNCYGDNKGMVPYIKSLFARTGFTFTDDDEWDLLWHFLPQRRYPPFEERFDPGLFNKKAVEHPSAPLRLWCDKRISTFFPGAGDKCLLTKYMGEVHAASPLQMHINDTDLFALPAENTRLAKAIRDSGEDVWMLKKCNGSKGRGQRMVTLAEVEGGDIHGWFVGQPYLNSPALYDGKKFHLRAYTLVTDWAKNENDGSIRAYIAKEGLLKVSSTTFQRVSGDALEKLNPTEKAKLLKQHNAYHVDESIRNGRMSSYLSSLGDEVRDKLWDVITAEIGRILACAPSKSGRFVPEAYGRCFDFFGLDIIFSEPLESGGVPPPKLLEVNLGPLIGVVPGDEEDLAMKTGIVGAVMAWAAAELQSTAPIRGSTDRIKAEEQILMAQFEKLPTAIVNEVEQCGHKPGSNVMASSMESIGGKFVLKSGFKIKNVVQ